MDKECNKERLTIHYPESACNLKIYLHTIKMNLRKDNKPKRRKNKREKRRIN